MKSYLTRSFVTKVVRSSQAISADATAESSCHRVGKVVLAPRLVVYGPGPEPAALLLWSSFGSLPKDSQSVTAARTQHSHYMACLLRDHLRNLALCREVRNVLS